MNQEEQKVVNKIKGLLRQSVAPWCIRCHEKMKANGRGWYCNNRLCYPDNPEAPWCLPCQTEMVAYGYSSTRAQRWMCPCCTRTLSSTYLSYLDHASPKREIRKPEKYEEAVRLFRAGRSVRSVAHALGIHHMTALRYRNAGVKEDVRCECGESAKHQGWCWWRYQQSPKRQEFMQRWHSKDA
jgi:transposase-like protein